MTLAPLAAKSGINGGMTCTSGGITQRRRLTEPKKARQPSKPLKRRRLAAARIEGAELQHRAYHRRQLPALPPPARTRNRLCYSQQSRKADDLQSLTYASGLNHLGEKEILNLQGDDEGHRAQTPCQYYGCRLKQA